MAKISALTSGAPAVNATDFVAISRSGANYKLSLAELKAIAAVTSGTITGITDLAVADGGTGASTAAGAIANLGVRGVLGGSAIPLVNLSSGSVAANGAISGITALPRIYANAYCYFPANILATTIAAGWYYCTFSSTTAGTAFLNTYTPGTMPTIPGSPTAVSDGKGAFTGVTTEIENYAITLPANTLGVDGAFHLWQNMECNNTANAKNHRVRFSTSGGTAVANFVLTSTTGVVGETITSNRGATNVQATVGLGQARAATGVASADVVSAIDTTAGTVISITTQKATATDNIVFAYVLAEYRR